MPDPTLFLAAAAAEAGTAVSVGMASGQLPPQLRELMFLAAAETESAHPVGSGAVPLTLSPQLRALVGRLATALRTIPPARVADFEHSVADFIDRWLSQNGADA